MASPLEFRRTALWFAAFVPSALLAFYGTGLNPVWWLAWLAPLPILWAAARLSGWSCAALAFAAWMVGGLNMWSYLHDNLSAPLAVCITATVIPAVLFTLVVLLYRRLILRGQLGWAVLGFPAAWVTCEFLNSTFSPHSTFGSVAYSQMNWLPVLQIASLTGIWGISFCLFLFPAAVAALLSGKGTTSQKRGVALAVAAWFVAVLGFGEWRLHTTPGGASVTVGLVASDLRQNIFTEKPDDTLRLLTEYSAQVEQLVAQGAQAVVIPEKIGVIVDSKLPADSNLPAVDSLFTEISRRTGATILIGVVRVGPTAEFNEARLYRGGQVGTYEKHHMLPAFESQFVVGEDRLTLDPPSGRWGITICKDMDFPRLSRQYSADGAGLMLVPAWDFTVDGWLHGRMAILRGVESGFSIARAPRLGILSVTDNRGRVLAERDTGAAPFASLIARVPVLHERTLYSRWGDWFAWLNLAVLAVALVQSIKAKSKWTAESLTLLSSSAA